jgi:hypothetical protein
VSVRLLTPTAAASSSMSTMSPVSVIFFILVLKLAGFRRLPHGFVDRYNWLAIVNQFLLYQQCKPLACVVL